MDTDLRTLYMSWHPVTRSGRKVVRVEEVDMLADVPKASCIKTDPAPLDKGAMELWGWAGEKATRSRKVGVQTCHPHCQLCHQSLGSLADTQLGRV